MFTLTFVYTYVLMTIYIHPPYNIPPPYCTKALTRALEANSPKWIELVTCLWLGYALLIVLLFAGSLVKSRSEESP